MKLLQRFRKQASREEMESEAAQELEAAVAAKPTDVPAMAPAAGLPGDDMNGSGGSGETPGAADAAAQGENGEPLGSVTDLPERRSATTRKTGTRKPATGTRTAGAKAGATTAKPAAKDKAPVRKSAAKKTASGAAGAAVKNRASAAGTSGTSGRASASRPPAAKKRRPSSGD